jgi:hypothetical protein
MAVIANIDDTLSFVLQIIITINIFFSFCRSFLLNRNSFDRLYQNYLSERPFYLELFQRFVLFSTNNETKKISFFSLPHAIETLHLLKLPIKLIALIDNSTGIYHKSTVSTSTSSSSISLEATTSTNYLPQNENDNQNPGDMSLYEWITAQVILFLFKLDYLGQIFTYKKMLRNFQ